MKDFEEQAISLLKEIREEAGLSQGELGSRLGHNQSWIQKREAGVTPVKLADMDRWAAACGRQPFLAFRQPGEDAVSHALWLGAYWTMLPPEQRKIVQSLLRLFLQKRKSDQILLEAAKRLTGPSTVATAEALREAASGSESVTELDAVHDLFSQVLFLSKEE